MLEVMGDRIGESRQGMLFSESRATQSEGGLKAQPSEDRRKSGGYIEC